VARAEASPDEEKPAGLRGGADGSSPAVEERPGEEGEPDRQPSARGLKRILTAAGEVGRRRESDRERAGSLYGELMRSAPEPAG
jgi:hypothetical protein